MNMTEFIRLEMERRKDIPHSESLAFIFAPPAVNTVCDSLIVNTSHTLKNKLARLLYIFQRALTVPFSRPCAQRHGHCSGSFNEIPSNTFIIIFQMSRFFYALK